MFNNNNQFIDKDELERTYRYQEKLFNAKIAEQQLMINEIIDYISSRFGDDVNESNINEKILNIENYLQKLEQSFKVNLQTNINSIKKDIENKHNDFSEEITSLHSIIKNHINDLEEKSSDWFTKANKKIENNEGKFKRIRETFNKELLQLKQKEEDISFKLEKNIENSNDLSDDITKLYKSLQTNEECLNNINLKLLENDAEVKNENKRTEIIINTLEEQWSEKINEILKNSESTSKKIEDRIEKNNIKQNEEVHSNILNIRTEINNLKDKICNYTDGANDLKNSYCQLKKNVDGAVEKINKLLINLQNQINENNKKSQVNIKAYVDSKNIAITNELKDSINKLNLSILEKEKLQKLEIEKLFNKKLKEIQKENEINLNKKIQEINAFIRKNSFNTTQNSIEKIDEPKVIINKRKNIYEPFDTNQMLRQSASNIKITPEKKEGKSQILKFFYDDEDLN